MQINLVVGDYFAEKTDILKYTDGASDLITWLRSKTIVLGLLKEAQLTANKIPVAVIRAVLTRWTCHLRSYERLLILQPSLKAIVYTDESKDEKSKLIITGDAKAKAKSTEMCILIKQDLF